MDDAIEPSSLGFDVNDFGIEWPSSTPRQLGSQAVKYEEALRHPSSGSFSQRQQMFTGSPRISSQQDRGSVTGIKKEKVYLNSTPDFPLPPANNQQYPPNMNSAPPYIAVSNSLSLDRLRNLPKETMGRLSIFYCVAPPSLRIYRFAGELLHPHTCRPCTQRSRPQSLRSTTTLQCRRIPFSHSATQRRPRRCSHQEPLTTRKIKICCQTLLGSKRILA